MARQERRNDTRDCLRICGVVIVIWLVITLSVRRFTVRASTAPDRAVVASFDKTAKQPVDEPRIGGGFPRYSEPSRVVVQPSGTTSGDSPVAAAPYPTELLVNAVDLAGPAGVDDLRVLDVRPRFKYADRHVPGAVGVDLSDWSFEADRTRSTWERKLGQLGVDLGTPVVVYDDGTGKDATYLWWLLRYWGVRDVRVLNGGWPAWLLAGAPQASGETKVKPRSVRLKPDPARLVGMNQAPGLMKKRRGQWIDVTGKSDLPSARRLQSNDLLDRRELRFKSAIALSRLLESAKVGSSGPTMIYSDSVKEAAPLVFALELLGSDQVRLCIQGWDKPDGRANAPARAAASNRQLRTIDRP